MNPQRIRSVTNEFGRPVRFYDDWIGRLYVLRDSLGVVGFVRAGSWEEAHDIAEGELYPEATMTLAEIAADLGCPVDAVTGDACFWEQYGFRPNGANATDTIREGIYLRDLNGDRLDAVDDAWLARHGYIVTYETADKE